MAAIFAGAHGLASEVDARGDRSGMDGWVFLDVWT